MGKGKEEVGGEEMRSRTGLGSAMLNEGEGETRSAHQQGSTEEQEGVGPYRECSGGREGRA